MPKLSSAETPPEKSSDCLPVSTIALSGVITRMPLVCMSIVASAFQYGWAPTLMPATTTLISPPAWVNSTIRSQRRGHPVHVLGAGVHRDPGTGGEREPLDRHLHPLGEVEGRDDPRALRLGDRAQRLGRVAAEHDAGDALGVRGGGGGHDGRR